MIDWLTVIVECNHDSEALNDGLVQSIDRNGGLAWKIHKALSVEGSHSTKIQMKSYDDNHVFISGNPTKFLQGHNIFGTNDLVALFYDFFRVLVSMPDLGLFPTGEQLGKIKRGIFEIKRVDLNESWHFKSLDEALAFIRALSEASTLKHRGRGEFSGDTLYYGKRSRRWALKVYAKGNEILAKGHRLHIDLQTDELIDYASRSVRFEVVLRAIELKERGLNYGYMWSESVATNVLEYYLDKLEISEKKMIKDDVLNELPNKLKCYYLAWRGGADLRKELSKTTYYRLRKEFKAFGIDIGIIKKSKDNKEVEIKTIIAERPAGIPIWAYKQGLVHEPSYTFTPPTIH